MKRRKPFSSLSKVDQWESLWGNYIDKKERLDELVGQGRYGYQLRMPKKALRLAYEALKKWATENNETLPWENA